MVKDISTISDNVAEAGVIATLVYHPEFVLQTDYLKPGYFYHVENGCLYWAIQELYKSGVDTIDAFNIANMLNSNKAVKRQIEKHNLTNLEEFISDCQYAARGTLEEYKLLVHNVVSMAFKRDLVRTTTEIQNSCFDEKTDLSKLNSMVNNKITGLTEKYIISSDIRPFGDYVDDLWEQTCSRRTDTGYYGIPSKFSVLNEYVTYEPGELVLLKARMKKGKSAFFLNEAMHKIKNGVSTLYIDTEMQDRLFLERVLGNLTQIPCKSIKRGAYSNEEYQKIKEAKEWLKRQNFVHIYMPQPNMDEIYSLNKILKYKMNLEFSIYDYIKSNIASANENYNYLGELTDFLKNRVAGELNIALLAGAQLNRGNEVADSDKLERYVSTSIHWREKTSEEIMRDGGLDYGNFLMIVDKNRNGEQMAEDEYIDMKFDGKTMVIQQAKQHTPPSELPFE